VIRKLDLHSIAELTRYAVREGANPPGVVSRLFGSSAPLWEGS